jgi:lysophospholipase L1-like esterase
MKKIRTWIVVIVLCFVGIEIGFRAVCSIRVGPDMLLYGTPWCGQSLQRAKIEKTHSVMYHDCSLSNYSKYFPNQDRKDTDEYGDVFNVTINRQGFRGKDFITKKEHGTIRVVALGASSTFGYFDRDNETYPYYMEKMLTEKLPEITFEVINLGIPHLRSENIYSLFECEALKLCPDFVTYYGGYNDAAIHTKKNSSSGFIPNIFKNRLLTITFIESILENNIISYSKTECERNQRNICEKYLSNIAKIHQECIDHDIVLIIANQQAKSEAIPRESLKAVTYRQEIEMVKQKLKRENKISAKEKFFLMHGTLMEKLERFAAENNIAYVDVIKALDGNRDMLLSYIHISAKGNKIIAGVICDKIAQYAEVAKTGEKTFPSNIRTMKLQGETSVSRPN